MRCEWYLQKLWPLFAKLLSAVTSERVFKENVGTSLKPNYMQLCSIRDHSSETSFLFHASSLIHSEQAVLAEPRIRLPSGKVKWGQANKAKRKTQHWQRKKERKREKPVSLHMLCVQAGGKYLAKHWFGTRVIKQKYDIWYEWQIWPEASCWGM